MCVAMRAADPPNDDAGCFPPADGACEGDEALVARAGRGDSDARVMYGPATVYHEALKRHGDVYGVGRV